MLNDDNKLSVEIIRDLIKSHSDETIILHYKRLGYSVPATADMIKRCKIKAGIIPRLGYKNNSIRTWVRPGGISDAIGK